MTQHNQDKNYIIVHIEQTSGNMRILTKANIESVKKSFENEKKSVIHKYQSGDFIIKNEKINEYKSMVYVYEFDVYVEKVQPLKKLMNKLGFKNKPSIKKERNVKSVALISNSIKDWANMPLKNKVMFESRAKAFTESVRIQQFVRREKEKIESEQIATNQNRKTQSVEELNLIIMHIDDLPK